MKGVQVKMDGGPTETFENNSGFEYTFKTESPLLHIFRTEKKNAGVTNIFRTFRDWKFVTYF